MVGGQLRETSLHPCGRAHRPGGWIWKTSELPKVIYRLPEVLAELEKPKPVIDVCEGEKDADTVAGLGYCATSFMGVELVNEWAVYMLDSWLREPASLTAGAR